MKRILHILSQRPEKTGSGIYLQSVLKEANKKGYKQAVISGIPAEIEKVDLGNINKENFYPVKFNNDELSFPVVGMSDVMPYPSTRYKDLTDNMLEKYKNNFSKVIKKAVKEFRPDIIITHHLWILTSLVRKLNPDIRIIAISHGTGLRQLKKVSKFKNHVLEGCQGLDMVFALNKYQKKQINRLYNIDENKIIVIGAGYDKEIFYESEKIKKNNEEITIVYAGKLSYAKGVKFLVKAFERLNSKIGENIRLKLLGEGNGREFEEIKRLVNMSESKIEMPGSVPQQKLGEIFRKSDIFCLPSFYEGLALVVIEALASGLRVVTTDLPGLKNWLGNKINQSEVIEYIELPTLENADIPQKEDLTGFEKRLMMGLEKQIDKSQKNRFFENEKLKSAVRKLSWEGVFARMEKYFQKGI